ELRGGKRADGIAALRYGLNAVPEKDRYELSWTLANILIDSGELDEAKAVMGKIREDVRATGAADYLTARGLMQEGRWFEAARALEGVRSVVTGATELSVEVDLMLGTCYERLEEPTQQLAACLRAAKTDPASIPARRGLVAALWSLGQADEAI